MIQSKSNHHLKEFMLTSLRDADTSSDYYVTEIERLESYQKNPQTAKALRKELKAKYTKDIKYYSAELAKEDKRFADRNAWIKALRSSL